jgi:hypothetical protein
MKLRKTRSEYSSGTTTGRILAALSDRRWHLFGEVLAVVGSTISPEIAYRRHVTEVKNSVKRGKQKKTGLEKLSRDQIVQLGRTVAIGRSCRDLRQCGRLEFETDVAFLDLSTRIRLIFAYCSGCGGPVVVPEGLCSDCGDRWPDVAAGMRDGWRKLYPDVNAVVRPKGGKKRE